MTTKRRHLLLLALVWITAGSCSFDFNALSSEDSRAERGPFAVLFHLSGPMRDFDSLNVLLGGPETSTQELRQSLHRASRDVLVQEIIFHIDTLQVGWSRAGELSDAIESAARNKPVTCLLESADNLTYWMAARVCPKVHLAPAGGLHLTGISMESIYLKDLLEMIGIQADMMSVGKYKNAAETLLRNDMSEAAREAATSLIEDISSRLISDVASGRKLNTETAQQRLDSGPFTPTEALEQGLVDQVQSIAALRHHLEAQYRGGVVTDYGKTPQKEMNFGDLLRMVSGSTDSRKKRTAPKIAIIPVLGTIYSGRPAGGLFGEADAVYDVPLIDTLLQAARDDSVKAVVLRIDSPGGSALASDNIHEAVTLLRQHKPVVASLGDVAASGGYYIASAANLIYAGENTITGSIGVMGGKIVIGDALKKIGIHSDRVESGPRAGMLSPFRPFSDEERASVQQSMDHVYRLFVQRVAEGRNLPEQTVLKVAEGRIWTGKQAISHKLADRPGGLREALARARHMVNMPDLNAEVYPPPKTFMEYLGEALSGTSATTRILMHLPAVQTALQTSALLSSETVVTLCPLTLCFR